jgi:putative FmdB family regulatory protein
LPINKYEFLKCGERFELLRSISASNREITFPYCENRDARRMLSTFAVGSSGEACALNTLT